METLKFVAVLALVLSIPTTTLAETCTPLRNRTDHIARSHKSIAQFKKTNPCPGTQRTTGACRNYVIDHIVPLCACGEDTPTNMQWQTVADAKIKDQEERKLCGQNRRRTE